MKNVSSILLCTALLSLVACGKNTNRSEKPIAQDRLLSQDGHYRAILRSMNDHVGGNVTGEVLMKVKGDLFNVEVKVSGAAAQIAHAQYLHSGSACPTLSADVNKDGVIDVKEGSKSFGSTLLPLSTDLKNASAGFPKADFSGNYYYRQTVSMNEMLKNLNKNMNLVGRPVVIYGTSISETLPSSVATLNGLSKHASLPIACGTLVKIAVDEGPSNGGWKE
jgi:hypothetical protein